jgi:hypothetical protein
MHEVVAGENAAATLAEMRSAAMNFMVTVVGDTKGDLPRGDVTTINTSCPIHHQRRGQGKVEEDGSRATQSLNGRWEDARIDDVRNSDE